MAHKSLPQIENTRDYCIPNQRLSETSRSNTDSSTDTLASFGTCLAVAVVGWGRPFVDEFWLTRSEFSSQHMTSFKLGPDVKYTILPFMVCYCKTHRPAFPIPNAFPSAVSSNQLSVVLQGRYQMLADGLVTFVSSHHDASHQSPVHRDCQLSYSSSRYTGILSRGTALYQR